MQRRLLRFTFLIAAAIACAELAGCGGGGGSSGTPLLGSGTTQAQGWSVAIAGTAFASGASTGTCTSQSGGGILCNVTGHNNTADPTSGAIIENYQVQLVATVTNNGGPVAGATVTFSMGSFSSATSGSYCDTSTTTTTPNCAAGGIPGTLKAIVYAPGLNDGTGKITTPITATTGADGKAYAAYYPGGQPGVDVVSVVATNGPTTGTATTLQAQNSATMVVN